MPEPASGQLRRPDRETIAYVQSDGRAPGVVFLGGFMSDMTGTKATALEHYCRGRGQAFLRFDYSGHGASSGRFADGTISRWTADALAAIDSLTTGPVVLVGSSMGGWIMLLAALARPDRVKGLVGVAAAPDFTERMWHHELGDAQRAAITGAGFTEIPSDYDDGPYVITKALIEDGRRHLVLESAIDLACPVRLLHGMEDSAVPWRTAIKIADALGGCDVAVTLIKNGDHRLSEPADLSRLCMTVESLLR